MVPRTESLAILYQGALTAAVRILARRQDPGQAEAFRRRMKDVLAEIGREAQRRGYAREHTAESDFAFVAFLDEVILTSDYKCRAEWAQRPLQEELFGVSTAGEVFFTRLEKLLAQPDSAELIDVLELYSLCLLLGFQGRYAAGGRAESQLWSDRIRQRIERFRGTRSALSPQGLLPEESIRVAAADRWVARLRWAAAAAAALALGGFAGYAAHLYWLAGRVNEQLLGTVIP